MYPSADLSLLMSWLLKFKIIQNLRNKRWTKDVPGNLRPPSKVFTIDSIRDQITLDSQ